MQSLFLFHNALFSKKVLTAHKLTLTFEIIMISSTLEAKKMLQFELCASESFRREETLAADETWIETRSLTTATFHPLIDKIDDVEDGICVDEKSVKVGSM